MDHWAKTEAFLKYLLPLARRPDGGILSTRWASEKEHPRRLIRDTPHEG